MITIGKRVLIASFPQLLIQKEDDAVIDVDVHGWKLKVTIHFDDSAAEQGIGIEPYPDGVRLTFRKWDNTLGIALRSPARLAKLGAGGALDFMAANYRIGDTNNFTIQFLHDRD